MAVSSSNARSITRKAKSNLAFALGSLPSERRGDMVTFYAFCRLVDDIADDSEVPVNRREASLLLWRDALCREVPGEDPLASEVRSLAAKYRIPIERFEEILEGVTRDLRPQTFGTAEDLEKYCHLVASVVGLVSIEIFGYKDPACRDYALSLGQALQWTNILRDVAQDAKVGRLYLPLADLHRFQITDAEVLGGTMDGRFRALMEHEYHRTEAYFQKAVAILPKRDRKSMVAAETMRRIYHALLLKMRADGFQVFSKRYRLAKPHMLWLLLATRLGWERRARNSR
ncbi:MAG: phytoene/squalene synthase family protein [Verrucomicrobiales bacterium]